MANGPSIESPSNQTDNFGGDGSVITAGTVPPQTVNADDKTSLRLSASGLISGAKNLYQKYAGQVFNFNFKAANGTALAGTNDWRVRISMQPATARLFYSAANMITRPLVATNGVIFPYTPQVTIAHQARYGAQPLTHSNYNAYFYEGSEVQAITITGEFTVQNYQEGQYLMAVIQFFRSCTKMFYGKDELAGTPPPLVFLNGYGSAYLPNVPCIVQSFSHTMPSDVDYLEVPIGGTIISGITIDGIVQGPVDTSNLAVRTRLPTTSSITVMLQPVYSRNNIARNFSLNEYAQGGLIKGPQNPTGGFL